MGDSFLARQSPALPEGVAPASITIKTTRPGDRVTSDVGHETLSHFLSGAVRFVSCNASRLKHMWKIQLGPFATHTIHLEKRYHLGKYVELAVDGTTLVQARAADMCGKDEWRC